MLKSPSLLLYYHPSNYPITLHNFSYLLLLNKHAIYFSLLFLRFLLKSSPLLNNYSTTQNCVNVIPSFPSKSRAPFLFLISSVFQSMATEKPIESSRLDFGKMEFGCEHYRRRCKIRAPCCNEIFICRHCHNEASKHEICRQDVKKVICLVCDTEQEVTQVCTNCGVNMGEYFCEICKFYDDDTKKLQYHCDDCGICRVGGKDNYFHCKKCGSCYSNGLRDKHSCVENSMKNQCPICYEYLFDSLNETRVLKCGHTLHAECLSEMMTHDQYSCPLCSKSIADLSNYWRKLDEEIQATLMPLDYRYKVWILCNDCISTNQVQFHIIGHKCPNCESYNTRTIAPPPEISQ